MKYGRSLQELAIELDRQAKVKKDYVATAGAMQMTAVNENFDLVIGNTPFQLNENAHRQLGLQLKIPAPYYERMRAENPGLLMANVNGWFQQSPDTRRMVRTLDGTARAILSDRYRRIDNYEVAQTVLPIISEMQGARIESCELTDTRMYIKVVNERIANTKMERITRGGKFYPIYDWKDSDVWLYIKERNLEFPEIYMRLYEAGVRKNALRLCAFFGDCGTQGLRWIAETDNDLWERIQRREPNAYLVLLYWDSEMFRRTTRKRGELEEESEKKDYKALCKDLLFLHPERYTIAKDTLSHIEHWRGLFIKTYGIAEQKHYKTMYEGLLYGDPKMRILRILWTTIYNDHNARIKEEQNHGKH